MADEGPAPSSVTPEALTAAVERHGTPGARVDATRRLTGGASRETWSFDVRRSDGETVGLVLRRDRPGGLGADTALEQRLIELAERHAVPVPRVVFALDEGDGLGTGYVMERIDGETIPRRILRDERFATARPLMARQAGEIAARIHGIPTDSLPELPAPDDSGHPALDQVAQYRELLDAYGEPHPVFELGLGWLEQHAPPPAEVALVHGDFRNGNFIVGPDGIRAILDWELAHLGDPMEDLGWLCARAWRFREVDHPVGGFGDYDDLFAGYEAVSGRPVDPRAVHFWEVFGTLKWGEMCIIQAFTHLQGHHRSVELATIGRRVAEQEHHLLQMID